MAETNTEEPSAEQSAKGFTRGELASVTIETDDIPIRGSPEEFLILIDELKGSGTRKIGDINEAIDDFGRTNLSGNVKYGENLGFIERTTDGIILTEKGVELAYAQDNEDNLSNYFKDGLRQEESYLALLMEFEEDSDYQSQIKNSDVLQVMYTNHSLREEKDSVLKRATSIIFETLELAGFGEVKEASGGLPTRFNLSDSWETDSALAELVAVEPDDEEKVTETKSDSQNGENDGKEDESNSSHQHDKDDDDEDEVAIEEIGELSDGSGGVSGNGDSSQDAHMKSGNGNQDVVINIELHLDVNEMDSAELGKKVKHINELLK